MRVFTRLSSPLALAVVLALNPSPALPQPAQCGRIAQGSSAAAITLIIAGIAGQTIHLCGWDVTATAVGTFQLVTGTGATCGTGTVNITAAHSIGATTALASAGATPGRYSTPQPSPPTNPPNSVCVIVTGTGPVQWTVFYTQF